MRLLLAVALLLAVPLLHPAAALLVVNGSAEICYTPAAFGPVVADSKFAEANLSGAVTLPADPANRDGCAPLDGDAGMVGCRVAVLARGTCPFVTKVRNAQRAGCSGVVVTNNRCDPATALVSMGDGGDGGAADIAIPSIFVTQEAGERYLTVGATVQLDGSTECEPTPDCEGGGGGDGGAGECGRVWDSSLLVLILLATATLTVGSRESGKKLLARRAAILAAIAAGPQAGPPPPPPEDEFVITAKMALLYALFASCGLLGMYFVMVVLSAFSVVMFMIVYVCVLSCAFSWALWSEWLLPVLPATKMTIPRVGVFSVAYMAIGICCISVGLVFFFNRHESWSWMLQDFLCLHLCIFAIRTFELPNMKVATILLCGLFCYDIFWVYISPHIIAYFNDDHTATATDPNHSVMVKVARGVEATPTHPQGEAMPMVIRMPHLGGGGSGSTGSSESMLGLGDIIVPALSTALLWRFDVAAGVPLGRFGRSLQSSAAVFKRSLFLPSLIGYVLALLCAYFAVVNFCVAQPALFYIVPLSQWTTLLIAWWRGSLPNLWADGPAMPAIPSRAGGNVQEAGGAANGPAQPAAAAAGDGDGLGAGLLSGAEVEVGRAEPPGPDPPDKEAAMPPDKEMATHCVENQLSPTLSNTL